MLQVTADVRTTQSSTFAAHQSLRFPRIQEIRWDKDAADVQTQQELDALTDEQRTGEAGKPPSLVPSRTRISEASLPLVCFSLFVPDCNILTGKIRPSHDVLYEQSQHRDLQMYLSNVAAAILCVLGTWQPCSLWQLLGVGDHLYVCLVSALLNPSCTVIRFMPY